MPEIKTAAQIKLEHMDEFSPNAMMLVPESEVRVLRKLAAPRPFDTYGNHLTAIMSESYRAGARITLMKLGLWQEKSSPVCHHGEAQSK